MPRKLPNRKLVQGKAAQTFFEAIRSPATRESYERRLIFFLNSIEMSADEFIMKARANPTWAQETVLVHMLKQKERFLNKEIQASSVRTYLKPLKLLLEMNDVTGINWKKISRMMPAARRYALDRAPTLEELRRMVESSDVRFQAIILIMASSGIRIGAWDYLNWGHVEPIERDGKVIAAKLTVYAGEPEEYLTFVTPEAFHKLDEYVKFRRLHGEKITKDSPLARDKWQTTTGNWGRNFVGTAEHPIRLQSLGVKRLFEDMMWRLKFRTERKKRHEFSIHSIRKFFKTRAEQVMHPINVETLMGHSTGISDSYYRPTDNELLTDYLHAVPLLSITEVEEVRQQSLEVEKANSERLRSLEATVAQLTALLGERAREAERRVLLQDPSRRPGT